MGGGVIFQFTFVTERTVEALDELLRPIMQDVAMLKANWGLFAELGAKAECRRNAAEWEEWGTRNEIESVHTRMRTFFGIKRDMPKFGKYYKLGTRHLEASCAHCEPAHRETPCRTCLGGIYGRRCVELAASKVMQTVNLMKFREEAAKEAKDYLHRIRGEYRHESIHKLDKVIKEIEEKLMLA